MERFYRTGCCNECGGAISAKGDKGNQGATGATGAVGGYGGFSSEWLFDTANGGAPADTFMRMNGADVPTAVTSITIAQVNGLSADLTAFLSSLTNGSKYGYIRIFQKADSTKFWYGQITNVIDSGAYWTLAVTYFLATNTVSTLTIFPASTSVVVSFSPAGPSSPSILDNDRTSATTVSGAGFISLISFTVPINQLKTNGDVLEGQVSFTKVNSAVNSQANITVYLDTVLMHTAFGLSLYAADLYSLLKFRITRVSATTVVVDFELINSDTNRIITNTGTAFMQITPRTVSNLTTNTVLLDIQAQSAFSTITANQLIVKYFNK